MSESITKAYLNDLHLLEENHKLKSLLAECQAVLEFYGDEDNHMRYERSIGVAAAGNEVFLEYSDVEDDDGTKAREMLAKLKERK